MFALWRLCWSSICGLAHIWSGFVCLFLPAVSCSSFVSSPFQELWFRSVFCITDSWTLHGDPIWESLEKIAVLKWGFFGKWFQKITRRGTWKWDRRGKTGSTGAEISRLLLSFSGDLWKMVWHPPLHYLPREGPGVLTPPLPFSTDTAASCPAPFSCSQRKPVTGACSGNHWQVREWWALRGYVRAGYWQHLLGEVKLTLQADGVCGMLDQECCSRHLGRHQLDF